MEGGCLTFYTIDLLYWRNCDISKEWYIGLKKLLYSLDVSKSRWYQTGDQNHCDIPFICLPINPLTLLFTVSGRFQHELLQGDEARVFPGRHWARLSYRPHDSSGPRKRPAGRCRGYRQTVTDQVIKAVECQILWVLNNNCRNKFLIHSYIGFIKV